MQVRYQAALRPDVAKVYQSGRTIRPVSAQQFDDVLQLLLEHREGGAPRLGPARRRGRGVRGARRCRAQVFVQAVARTADGETLFVQELADSPDQQHLVMLVVAAIAASLDRTKLGEFLFPVTQDVRLDPA